MKLNGVMPAQPGFYKVLYWFRNNTVDTLRLPIIAWCVESVIRNSVLTNWVTPIVPFQSENAAYVIEMPDGRVYDEGAEEMFPDLDAFVRRQFL